MNPVTIYLKDASAYLDEQLRNTTIHKLPPIRQRQLSRYTQDKDKALCIQTGLLVNEALKALSLDQSLFHYEDGHKPALDSMHFISISHSWPYAAVAVADCPIGIDIETVSDHLFPVGKRYFSQKELSYCQNDPMKLLEVWCKKECMIKRDGFKDLKSLDTTSIHSDDTFIIEAIHKHLLVVYLPKEKACFHAYP